MKKLIFAALLFVCIISCKKSRQDNSPIPPPATNANILYPTGLIPATVEELSKIKSIEELDTASLDRYISEKVESDDPFILKGLPISIKQRYNSCAAWSVGYELMSYYFRKILKNSDVKLSPAFIYNKLAGVKNEGLEYPETLEFVKTNGTCQYSLMDANIDLLDSVSYLSSQPSADAIKDALNYPIQDYLKFENEDFPLIKKCLRGDLPILISLHIDEAFQLSGYLKSSDYEKKPDGNIIWRKTLAYEDGGNHAMLVCGYSDSQNAFLVLNSWGPAWGLNGFIWIDYEVFNKEVKEAYLALPRFVTTLPIQSISRNVDIENYIRTYGELQTVSKGVCYSTEPQPSIDDPLDIMVTSASTDYDFTVTLKNLRATQKYYVRGFATDGTKTYYGNEQTFTTLAPSAPVITTTIPGSITSTSASSGGIITDDGGGDILAKGVTYSLDQNFGNSTSIDGGTGSGTFISSITGLTPNKTYYVRAYATNSAGTAYGNVVNFTTANSNNNNFIVSCGFLDGNGSPFATLGLNLTVNNGIVNGTIIGAAPTATAEVTGTISGSQMQLTIHTNNNYTTCSIDENGHARYNIDEVYSINGTTDSNLSFYNATFQYHKVSGNPMGINPCTTGPDNTYDLSGTCSW